ncbi:Do family serine endopeptidase [Acidithiobacillus sp. AMEEHan]|uniref:Do family serine endopeptidase n=1 Tax=Acidithiobacillus sp. AMEEHan TaxID=2994951 RepID=UPI0027E4E1CE|nr:Do family serine endopeptidase [Acidithiobacillus sp. AMEEHan]
MSDLISRFPQRRAIFAALTLVLLASGCAQAQVSAPKPVPSPTAPVTATPQSAALPPLVNLPDFTPLIERYGPTVVNISTTSEQAIPGAGNPFPPDSPFYRFFEHFGAPNGQSKQPPQEKVESLGSGFILSSDGYIVTAAHVVRHAKHIIVTLADHHAYPAKLVGLSVRYDTALLKIDANNLPTAPIGNSNDLKVGQWILAVGTPFGFSNSVTQGVVSALDRPLPDDEYIPFIQSDVPINPGNSGGPLFNMYGQVVGINDQIYTNNGGYMGLSFSIPINTVMSVVEDLKAHRAIQFGYLGVEVQSVTPDMAEALRLHEPVGALVASVEPDSPAARAGLQAGDVIVTFAGKPVYSVGQLPLLVGTKKPGTQVEIGILRHGKAVNLPITVGALPSPQKASDLESSPTPNPSVLKIERLGISTKPLSAKLKQELGIDQGVEVVDVHEGAAAEAGVQPGMIIEQFDQQVVQNPQQLQRLVAATPADKPVPVLIRQGKSSIFIVLRLPKKGS